MQREIDRVLGEVAAHSGLIATVMELPDGSGVPQSNHVHFLISYPGAPGPAGTTLAVPLAMMPSFSFTEEFASEARSRIDQNMEFLTNRAQGEAQ